MTNISAKNAKTKITEYIFLLLTFVVGITIGSVAAEISTNLDTDFFLNINTSAFKASIFAGIESKVNFALEKGLIDFLANGNELDQEFDVGAGVGVSVYEENSFSLEIPIKKLKIKAVPSYFYLTKALGKYAARFPFCDTSPHLQDLQHYLQFYH